MVTSIADPVLASALWNAHKARYDTDVWHDGGEACPRLRTGCKSIDNTLESGLAYGQGGICSLSFESGSGKQELLYAFLISHLLASTAATATVIDSQGLNILSLFTAIKARVALIPYTNPSLPQRDIDYEATLLLDRIKIARIFDFDGLLEALSEIRTEREGRQDMALDEGLPISTIQDSQMSEDEALISTPPQALPPARIANSRKPSDNDLHEPTPHLLVIDDLPSLLTPIQRNNHVHSSALLASLLRSLRHFCTSHLTLCLLVNGTINSSSSSYSAANSTTPTRPQPDQGFTPNQPQASIFASCSARPLFARILDPAIDVNILIHLVPLKPDDARLAYADPRQRVGEDGDERPRGRDGGHRASRAVEWAECFEVLADRIAGRTGRFGFFVCDGRGGVRDALP